MKIHCLSLQRVARARILARPRKLPSLSVLLVNFALFGVEIPYLPSWMSQYHCFAALFRPTEPDVEEPAAPPLLNGYLKKLGEHGIKTYKRRYFRQDGFKVSYYESDKDRLDHSKGAINVEQIQEVKRSTSHTNAFELVSKESKRTYVLQVCEPQDSVEEWMARWSAWIRYIKDTVWQRAQSSIGTASNPASMRLTGDLLKLSSWTTVEPAGAGDGLSSFPEETWPRVLSELESETAAQMVAITTLRAEVEELNQEYRVMGQTKENAVVRARAALKEELRQLEKHIAEHQKTLVCVDQQLVVKERQVMSCERLLGGSSELVELREAQLRSMKAQLERQTSDLRAQEGSLTALREANQHDPRLAQFHVSSLIESEVELLRRQWNANAEQQLSNEQLTRRLRRLEASVEARKEAETAAKAKLHKATELHQNAVDSIRNELAQAQHIDLSIIQEFEELRKRYFISLTLSIKLQGEVTGKRPAVDLSDLDALYRQALAQKPDHLDWNDWLAETLFPGTPKSLVLGRRRATSASAYGSSAPPSASFSQSGPSSSKVPVR